MERYKIIFWKRNQLGGWTSHSMDGFGRGYTLSEANVLKAHLESNPDYKDVKVVDLHYIEG